MMKAEYQCFVLYRLCKTLMPCLHASKSKKTEVSVIFLFLQTLQLRIARPAGFEPAAHGLEDRCSIH
jgi:hypothetical protein